MQYIDKKISADVEVVLNEFTDWFFSQDYVSKIDLAPKESNKKDVTDEVDEYYTSDEYHDSIDWDDHEGYPLYSHGVDLHLTGSTPIEWRDRCRELTSKLNNLLCSRFSAVMMYYPKDGFMGWHDNRNCPGYNILLSYTKNGKGFFRFKEDGKTITQYDKPGWNVRVGYYGSLEEEELQLRHCARAYEDRITLGFVIPSKVIWEGTVEDLCDDS